MILAPVDEIAELSGSAAAADCLGEPVEAHLLQAGALAEAADAPPVGRDRAAAPRQPPAQGWASADFVRFELYESDPAMLSQIPDSNTCSLNLLLFVVSVTDVDC